MNIYAKALKVLDGRGWCQGAYGKPDTGEVCLVGALYLAGMDRFYWRSEAQLPALHALRELEGWTWRTNGDPEDWNDAPERTVEDVRLLLKRASVELDDTWEWE